MLLVQYNRYWLTRYRFVGQTRVRLLDAAEGRWRAFVVIGSMPTPWIGPHARRALQTEREGEC
jgi:hypothetical protein